jgi:proline dehydrogenase
MEKKWTRVGVRFLSSSCKSVANKPVTGKILLEDAKRLFAAATTGELARSLAIFKVCAVPPVVANASRMYKLATVTVGHSLPDWVIRASFFKHFCGGESEHDLKPVMDKLGSCGIGAILDYAVEADVNAAPSGDRATQLDIFNESGCDANADSLVASIDAASAAASQTGREPFVACKFTGIGQPQLLERVGTILSSLDYAEWVEGLTEECSPWMHPAYSHLADAGVFIPLNLQEREQYARMIARANKLAEYAAEKGVKLLVDAEQTYLQLAIDHLSLLLMCRHNKEIPIVFNTYQCYLKDALERVKRDMDRADRQGFVFAAKTVRGAYMVQERRRAKERGYPNPVHDSKEETDACYDAVVAMIMSRKSTVRNEVRSPNQARQPAVMIASHNEESVIKAVHCMKQLNLTPKDGIYFAQLQGMCDHVSFALGQEGYAVFKYVPYGPVKEVMPYLLRRLEENSDIMGAVGKQRRMIWAELKRRVFSV